MKLKTLIFLLLTATGAIYAMDSDDEREAAREKKFGKYARYKFGRPITFRDYYYGNEKLNILGHKQNIDMEIHHGGMLQLSGLGLTDLEGIEEIPNILNLRSIMAADNLLSEVPPIIQQCVNLEKLTLTTNQITEIPDFIGTLKNLRQLWLGFNRLEKVPDAIGNLKRLKELSLQNNNLTSIPKSVGELPDLEQIQLFNNPIPLGHQQLRQEIGLRPSVTLFFKSDQQEKSEYELIQAIRAGNEEAFRARLKHILKEPLAPVFVIPTILPLESVSSDDIYYTHVDIAKIRDADGNNLLHVLVNALKRRLAEIATSPELSQAAKNEETKLTTERYTKMFLLFFDLGIPQAQHMLWQRNAKGNDVILAAMGALNFNKHNLFLETIMGLAYALTPARLKGGPARETRWIYRLPADQATQEKEEKEGKEIAEVKEQQAAQRTALQEARAFEQIRRMEAERLRKLKEDAD